MNPKINKLRAELEKNNEKMEKLQARNAELQEAENLEILGMVRACGMSVEEIVKLLKAAGGGQE